MAEIIKQIYKPSMNVGQVYARPYGAAIAPMPIGNVLELSLEHTEDVQTQEDMTRLGGGTHAEVRRVKEVKVKLKLADLNVINYARSVLGTTQAIEGAAVVDEPHHAFLGGLLRLAHIQPTAVTLKKGADKATATPVTAAGNYEVRPEGIYLLPDATDIANSDELWASYTYGAYAAIEALTSKAPELELTFGGLNEADGGKPVLVEIWRASQGITKTLALISKGFGALDVEGSVLMDPTKVGTSISRYYKTSMA
ncbi:hypothetical protein EZI45_19555 [Delftia tsuruhatensis]|jgi:hypothetical protein|uniref:phage tail tube protein n=1 Tax=Delftia TaxID=80865 RepID=UPI000354576A|nr:MULTISPECIES: hypothetical protein [Delftia]EPD41298.1 hypothetical protein HMPREF9701_01852 [Delftia acidovorans CCUG 274B]TDF26060.1 hypothetical protein EZI45_19555 [Delftia tsuruhatensis]